MQSHHRQQLLTSGANNIRLVGWGFVLSIVARKTVFVRQRWGELDYATVDTYAAVEILIVGMAWIFLLSSRHLSLLVRWLSGTSAAWLWAYCVVGMASALWSSQPAYAGFQAAEVASQLLLIFVVISYYERFADAERSVLVVCLATVLLGMCEVLKFRGVTLSIAAWHHNQFPASAGMLACYCAPEYFRASGERRKRLLIYGCTATFALLLGTSAASLLSTLFGLAIAALLMRRTAWPILLLVATLVLGAALDPNAATELLFPYKTAEQIQSLHGRTHLWGQLMDFFWERPILGYGFAMGAKLGGVGQTNTHNSILSVVLGTGLMGLLILVGFGVRFLKELSTKLSARRPGSTGVACALSAGLMNSMSMAFLGEGWRGPTLVFTAIYALLVVERLQTGKKLRRRSVRFAASHART